MSSSGRLPVVVAWAAGIACLLALAYRFRYGLELTDETFSIAMPYRFVLGDRPFVDEMGIQQTAGILLVPFVWAYVKITGGTAGIVLFVRWIHLLVKVTAALAVQSLARRWLVSRATALALAFVPFAYVPHSIANVGYNTLGTTLLVAGTFLSAAGVAGAKPDRRLLGLAGVAYGLCAFAYPPMVIGPLVAAVLVFACAPSQRFHALGYFVAGGAIAFVLVSPSLMFGGIAGVKKALAWGGAHPPDKARLKSILDAYWDMIPGFAIYAVIATGVARLLRARSLVVILACAIVLATTLSFRTEPLAARHAMRFITYLATFAPLMIVVARPDAKILRGAALILLPSYAAGIAAAVFSTQNGDAISLGFQPAMILFLVLAARSFEGGTGNAITGQLPAFAVMFILVVDVFDFVYRDQPLAQLTEQVRSGPYRGLYTTPDRLKVSNEMVDIAKRFDTPNGRLLVLYENPGLYLFSTMRPGADCVWEVHHYGQEGLLAYWREHTSPGSVVVHVHGTPRGPLVDGALELPDRKILETQHFSVYREP